MVERIWSVRGRVDASSGSTRGEIVTIELTEAASHALEEGDEVIVTARRKLEHECDWRFYGRRADGLSDVICVAERHDPNNRMRVAPLMGRLEDLPKYDGQLDV